MGTNIFHSCFSISILVLVDSVLQLIECTIVILPRSRNSWTLLSIALNLYKNEVIEVREMKKLKLPIQLPMTERAFLQMLNGLIILVVGFIIVLILTTPTGWVWVLLDHIIKVWRSWWFFDYIFPLIPPILQKVMFTIVIPNMLFWGGGVF